MDNNTREQVGRVETLSGGGPQLRKFIGTVQTWEPEINERFGGVNLKIIFTDLEVIEAETPFEFPIYDVSVKKPAVNQWGRISRKNAYSVLQESVTKLVKDFTNWDQVIGKRFVMEYTAEHTLVRPVVDDTEPRKFEDYKGSAWEAIEMIGQDGNAPVAAEVLALALLDGNTRQQFNLIAAGNQDIKDDRKLFGRIMNGEWFKDVVNAGKVTLDKDTYRVV